MEGTNQPILSSIILCCNSRVFCKFIGSESAGLRAAIEAHDAGAHVLILSKSTKGDPSERRDQMQHLELWILKIIGWYMQLIP